jgi:phosphonate transport system substrate-binding protein
MSGFHQSGVNVEGLDWIPTGSHRASIAAVLEGMVDLAPIDSTVLALERRADPRRLAQLVEIAVFGPLPSPPVVITGALRAQGDRLRELLSSLHESAAGRSILTLGGLERYVAVDDRLYDSVRAIDRF